VLLLRLPLLTSVLPTLNDGGADVLFSALVVVRRPRAEVSPGAKSDGAIAVDAKAGTLSAADIDGTQ